LPRSFSTDLGHGGAGDGDYFEVTALVSQLSEGRRLTARIAGVPRLVDTAASQSRGAFVLAQAPTEALVFLALLITGSVAVLHTLGRDDSKTDSRVVLKTGAPLCGDVMRVDKATLLLKLKGSGVLRTLPLNGTRSIKEDAC
jgi:hypothetical protein